MTQPSALDFSGDGPKILIVHTHASEAYTPEDGFSYEPSGELRTQDETRSVIRVGSEIARILEDAGIETLHDTTANDYPSYNGSYARMEAIIESYLAEYPSIQMVLDVHRDAVEDQAGFPCRAELQVRRRRLRAAHARCRHRRRWARTSAAGRRTSRMH